MKKLFSVILCLAMTLGTFTACCAADDEEWKSNTGKVDLNTMKVSGSGISVSGSTVAITKGGDFEVTGTLSNGMIYINSEEKVKLRLSGASITNSSGPAIYFDNAEKAFITITEGTENNLTDGKTYNDDDADGALFSNDDLEIKGSGTLNITGNYKHGIASDDDVSIENGTINISSYEHGIKANDKLTVSGGSITAVSETGKPMKAGAELIIDGGDLSLTSNQSEGIESKGTLTINGGNINVTAIDDGINTGNENTADSSNQSNGGFDGRRPDMNGEQAQFDGQRPPEMSSEQQQGSFEPGQKPEGIPQGALAAVPEWLTRKQRRPMRLQ